MKELEFQEIVQQVEKALEELNIISPNYLERNVRSFSS